MPIAPRVCFFPSWLANWENTVILSVIPYNTAYGAYVLEMFIAPEEYWEIYVSTSYGRQVHISLAERLSIAVTETNGFMHKT